MTANKKLACLDDLRRRILSLDIAPGSDLDEARLCDAYGISRTPLREVLHRLSGEGYIALTENRGAKVASMDVAALRTFFQTAPMIYATVARLAAENRTTAELEALKETQRQFTRATHAREAGKAAFLNHRFHEQIGEMAHNPYLLPALRRLLIDHTRLGQTFYRPASPAESLLVIKAIDQHEAMISAIESGEAALAASLTLEHWDLSRDRMDRYVRPDPLPHDVISLKDKRDAV